MFEFGFFFNLHPLVILIRFFFLNFNKKILVYFYFWPFLIPPSPAYVPSKSKKITPWIEESFPYNLKTFIWLQFFHYAKRPCSLTPSKIMTIGSGSCFLTQALILLLCTPIILVHFRYQQIPKNLDRLAFSNFGGVKGKEF